MNAPRVTPEDSIAFLVATPKEGGRRPRWPAASPSPRTRRRTTPSPVCGTAWTPSPAALWEEVRALLPAGGMLVFDDTVLDKLHARHMGLVGQFWSGRHARVVRGIDLMTAVWTDGDGLWACDSRLVGPADAPKRTKNEHLRDMLAVAKGRGLNPRCVCLDCWFSGLENRKAVSGSPCGRSCGWSGTGSPPG